MLDHVPPSQIAGSEPSFKLWKAIEQCAPRGKTDTAVEPLRCYFVYAGSHCGTCLTQWSTELVWGALAAFTPKEAVPIFKLRNNGGKTEIAREVDASVQRLYDSFIYFIKTAAKHRATFQQLGNLEGLPVSIYLNNWCGQVGESG